MRCKPGYYGLKTGGCYGAYYHWYSRRAGCGGKGCCGCYNGCGGCSVCPASDEGLDKNPDGLDRISALPDGEKLELLLMLQQSEKGAKFAKKHPEIFKPTGAAHSGRVGTLK
jgi:hypothetical protein